MSFECFQFAGESEKMASSFFLPDSESLLFFSFLDNYLIGNTWSCYGRIINHVATRSISCGYIPIMRICSAHKQLYYFVSVLSFFIYTITNNKRSAPFSQASVFWIGYFISWWFLRPWEINDLNSLNRRYFTERHLPFSIK